MPQCVSMNPKNTFDPERTFLGAQPHSMISQCFEDFLKVFYMLYTRVGFDYDIIYIYLDILAKHPLEDFTY